MKIKDLPQPYREMALIEQEAQGNKRNEILRLTKFKKEGNFDWEYSICYFVFWDNVNKLKYPEITPEIKAKFPSVFNYEAENEIMRLFEKYEQQTFYFYCIKDEYYKILAKEIVEKFINLKK